RSEGSIFERADGLWVCSLSLGYDGNGKRRRRTIYGKSKAEVQEKLREMQTAADRGTLPDAGSITVSQFLKTWLDAIKPTVAAHTPLADHRDCHNAIIPHLGGARMAAMTALHVQKLYADLEAAGVSASMRRKAGVTLSVALQYAVTVNLIPHNFARDVKKP